MLRILHLSDTHLYGDDTRHYGVVDTHDRLIRTLALVQHLSFDVVVCSGDVSEDGTAGSYQRAWDVLKPWCAARGAELVFAAGNHDQRDALREVCGGDDIDGAVTRVVSVGGWNIVVLDSSIPGRGDGAISSAQRAWAERALACASEQGSIIVVHHPPIAAQTDLLQALALRDDDAQWMLEIAARTSVRAILCGHYHLPLTAIVEGIPVIVTPGVANISRAVAARTEESSGDAYGGTVVDISARSVRAVPFFAGTPDRDVFHFDADAVTAIVDQTAPPA